MPEGRSKVQWVVAINSIIPTNQLQIAWLNPSGVDISGQRHKYSMSIDENTVLNQVKMKDFFRNYLSNIHVVFCGIDSTWDAPT